MDVFELIRERNRPEFQQLKKQLLNKTKDEVFAFIRSHIPAFNNYYITENDVLIYETFDCIMDGTALYVTIVNGIVDHIEVTLGRIQGFHSKID